MSDGGTLDEISRAIGRLEGTLSGLKDLVEQGNQSRAHDSEAMWNELRLVKHTANNAAQVNQSVGTLVANLKGNVDKLADMPTKIEGLENQVKRIDGVDERLEEISHKVDGHDNVIRKASWTAGIITSLFILLFNVLGWLIDHFQIIRHLVGKGNNA